MSYYRQKQQQSLASETNGKTNPGTQRCNNYVIRQNVGDVEKNLIYSKSMDTNHYRLAQRITRLHRIIASLLIIAIPLYASSFNLVSSSSDPFELFPRSLPSNVDSDVPDDCGACKILVKSFERGMAKTMRGKHEGGDTSWEERKLKSYADSEVRLVDIEEGLCEDSSKGKSKCFSMAEDAEKYIEDWWFNHRRNNVRLHDFLCINKLKKCCSEFAFGPNCQPCPSSNCNNHGVCDGVGTRGGTGECICESGYTGSQCKDCQQDYYQVHTLNANTPEQDQFTCLQCHNACTGGCSGPSSANCTDCKQGYRRDPITSQCMDINECELNSHGLSVGANKLCPEGTYCLNTEGYYKCADCHRSCSTCLGYGRNKCITCASDHFMDKDHNCIYTHDYNRHDPNIRHDENFVVYIWRRFQTDIVLKIMLNILLYPLVHWVVEKINYGGQLTRKVICFLATINLQMEIYPFVQKLILTNFGKNLSDANQYSDVSSTDDVDVAYDYPTSSEEL